MIAICISNENFNSMINWVTSTKTPIQQPETKHSILVLKIVFHNNINSGLEHMAPKETADELQQFYTCMYTETSTINLKPQTSNQIKQNKKTKKQTRVQ